MFKWVKIICMAIVGGVVLKFLDFFIFLASRRN